MPAELVFGLLVVWGVPTFMVGLIGLGNAALSLPEDSETERSTWARMFWLAPVWPIVAAYFFVKWLTQFIAWMWRMAWR